MRVSQAPASSIEAFLGHCHTGQWCSKFLHGEVPNTTRARARVCLRTDPDPRRSRAVYYNVGQRIWIDTSYTFTYPFLSFPCKIFAARRRFWWPQCAPWGPRLVLSTTRMRRSSRKSRIQTCKLMLAYMNRAHYVICLIFFFFFLCQSKLVNSPVLCITIIMHNF